MPVNPLPMPIETPMVDKNGIIEFSVWVTYFNQQSLILSQAPNRLVSEIVPGTAAIGATPLDVGTAGGFYRVNVYTRITRAATTDSSLTPTFRWTEGGVAQSRTYTALTGNTTTTILQDVFPMRIDSNTSVTYETAYVSNGATSMQYSLEMAVERLA